MPVVVLVMAVAVVVLLSRVGKRTATREFPLTWPTTEELSKSHGRRRPASTVVIVALFVGVGLGVLARIWMRLVAPDPEFTTAGTVGILTGFGLLFAVPACRWRPTATAGAHPDQPPRHLGRDRVLSRPLPIRFARATSCVEGPQRELSGSREQTHRPVSPRRQPARTGVLAVRAPPEPGGRRRRLRRNLQRIGTDPTCTRRRHADAGSPRGVPSRHGCHRRQQ